MSELNQNHPLPWSSMAWVLATTDDKSIRNVDQAIQIGERVCRATQFKEPSALDTLAVAYAAKGRFEDAARLAEKAIERCRELRQLELAKTIGRRLELYQAGKPFQRSAVVSPPR
jgi:spermidine synthase